MRTRVAQVFTILAIISVSVYGDVSPQTIPDTKQRLIGTWESQREADGFRQLKYITATHFIWVIYDVERRNPVGTAGGTWVLRDDTYEEQIEYASEGWAHLRGKTIGLKPSVKGDTWTVTGTLDTGFKIDETWKRQKAKP